MEIGTTLELKIQLISVSWGWGSRQHVKWHLAVTIERTAAELCLIRIPSINYWRGESFDHRVHAYHTATKVELHVIFKILERDRWASFRKDPWLIMSLPRWNSVRYASLLCENGRPLNSMGRFWKLKLLQLLWRHVGVFQEFFLEITHCIELMERETSRVALMYTSFIQSKCCMHPYRFMNDKHILEDS